MWNHLLSGHGDAFTYDSSSYVVPANGRPVLATAAIIKTQYPYYYRDGALDRFGGNYWLIKLTTTGPPFRVGEKSLGIYLAFLLLPNRGADS